MTNQPGRANPPESLADFRNNTEPLSTETLEIQLEALHNQLLHIGPRLHIIRSILQGRKNHEDS
jgi:hypothetical protein